jgi:hypothetical protein
VKSAPDVLIRTIRRLRLAPIPLSEGFGFSRLTCFSSPGRLLGPGPVKHSPDLLSFVLVDFKGGATFAGMTELPHVAGMITNLVDDLALACVGASCVFSAVWEELCS